MNVFPVWWNTSREGAPCLYIKLILFGPNCLFGCDVGGTFFHFFGRAFFSKYPPKSPVGLTCQGTVCIRVCVCVCEFSHPLSCIFAMSLKPGSINSTIPVFRVTSVFDQLTQSILFSLRKTSCPVPLIQWKNTQQCF